MNNKPISPALHGLLDYALMGSLLTVPTALKLPGDVKKLYTLEALVLLGYVRVTDQPLALKPLIPLRQTTNYPGRRAVLFCRNTANGQNFKT